MALRRSNFGPILALLLALATSPVWARPAPPEPGGGSAPVPTYAPPTATAYIPPTPVPLPAVGIQATAAPAAEAPAPLATCPGFTGNSSDFLTFYVACGQTVATYYGPGGDATGSSIGEGTYSVDDRRCFAGSTEFNCETNGGTRPNWFHTEGGWVSNGMQYIAPASVPTSQPAPAAQPAANAAVAATGQINYNIGYYSYLTSSTSAEGQATPGSVYLSAGTGYVTWQVTENGSVIQGPVTFTVQSGSTLFTINWQWPGMPVNEVTGNPDDGDYRTVTMEATLYANDGTQLAVAPAVSVSYQPETKLGPTEDEPSNHSDPRD